MSNSATKRQWEALGDEGQKGLVDGVALRRLGTPEDIANGVLFFASLLAAWVTGETLRINGGARAKRWTLGRLWLKCLASSGTYRPEPFDRTRLAHNRR